MEYIMRLTWLDKVAMEVGPAVDGESVLACEYVSIIQWWMHTWTVHFSFDACPSIPVTSCRWYFYHFLTIPHYSSITTCTHTYTHIDTYTLELKQCGANGLLSSSETRGNTWKTACEKKRVMRKGDMIQRERAKERAKWVVARWMNGYMIQVNWLTQPIHCVWIEDFYFFPFPQMERMKGEKEKKS